MPATDVETSGHAPPSPVEPRRRSVVDVFAPRTRVQQGVLAIALAFLAVSLGYFVGVRSEQDATPGAASADVGFLYDMTAHHQQAVEIAAIELVNGSDPIAKTFAREIMRSQSYEIGLMSMRLGTWGHDPFDVPDEAMAWMGMATTHDAMPGIAETDEIAALQAARGSDADALFYALMIDHHRGGVSMAQAAAQAADDPWAVDTAQSMARTQTLEINEMQIAVADAGLPTEPAGFVSDFPVDDSAGSHAGMDMSGGDG